MYLYENAIIDDINKTFKNSKVTTVIADSLDEGLRRSAAKNKDIVTLPLVILSGGDWDILDSNFYNQMHGSKVKSVLDNSVNKSANVLPIKPTYNMYIAAYSSRECDMLTREIIFHYILNPTLTIKVPYQLDYLHNFNIVFDRSVRKNQNSNGVSSVIYRILSFSLEGAYLWHNNSMNIIKDIDSTVEERIDENV